MFVPNTTINTFTIVQGYTVKKSTRIYIVFILTCRYHMMSEDSTGLFRRAIFASASPDSHWSFMSDQVATQ